MRGGGFGGWAGEGGAANGVMQRVCAMGWVKKGIRTLEAGRVNKMKRPKRIAICR